ncbi:MAG: hypothetical protein GWO20_13735 [Candidatus Korarchaeota archaeon]|nr:hypothetical protein [Candidatus Korarchaeota archaeon]
MVVVFLLSVLGTISIAPTIAENPVISEVERLKDICWFHLVTGQYPNGVWVGQWTPEGPRYYEEKGYLGLTYRNLSPDVQLIKLTTSPGANHAFYHWPEKTASEVWLGGDAGSTWTVWWVLPDELHLMDDLWFIGWDLGQQIEVTLELLEPYYDVLYQDTLTIMPLGP